MVPVRQACPAVGKRLHEPAASGPVAVQYWSLGQGSGKAKVQLLAEATAATQVPVRRIEVTWQEAPETQSEPAKILHVEFTACEAMALTAIHLPSLVELAPQQITASFAWGAQSLGTSKPQP